MPALGGLDYSFVSDSWAVENGLVFTSPLNPSHNEEVLVFNEMISDGFVEAKVTFNEEVEAPDIVSDKGKRRRRNHSVASLGFRYQDPANYYFAGLGAWSTKFSIGVVQNGQGRALASLGDDGSLEPGRGYKLRVEFSGSQLILLENGVRQLLAVDDTFSSGQWGFRTWKSRARFEDGRSDAKQPMCFIIMPFAQDFEMVNTVLQETLTGHGFRCERADTKFLTSPIIDDIKDSISKADLVVVDLTGKNANVYYEAGYALALNKRIIHIAQSASDLPFDVRHLRTFVYQFAFGGDRKLVEDLDRAIYEATGYARRAFATSSNGH